MKTYHEKLKKWEKKKYKHDFAVVVEVVLDDDEVMGTFKILKKFIFINNPHFVRYKLPEDGGFVVEVVEETSVDVDVDVVVVGLVVVVVLDVDVVVVVVKRTFF